MSLVSVVNAARSKTAFAIDSSDASFCCTSRELRFDTEAVAASAVVAVVVVASAVVAVVVLLLVAKEASGTRSVFVVLSILHHPSSIIHHPSSIIHHPSSIIHHPSFIIHHSSFIIHHSSFTSSSSSLLLLQTLSGGLCAIGASNCGVLDCCCCCMMDRSRAKAEIGPPFGFDDLWVRL